MAEDKKKLEGGFIPSINKVQEDLKTIEIEKEKVIQISLALNGVMALTNKGRMFMFSDDKWIACQQIDFDKFK